MKFRRQQVEDQGINLTPLIDVVFLLLIFFMVSTTFTKETHLSVDLPEAVGEQSSDLPEQIEILINSDGSYSVNGLALVNNQVATLRSALEKTSEGNNQVPLVITADAKTPHQAVVQAMDVAGQLGFARLSITTRQPEPEKD
ncbi:ExbD/TolR family protein [Cellvibrio sp. BR]|uniref:ExbD/TolR family protein n=1 Tax=unclassified Cellvibrio TaxID=2624793 RepID=UPI0002600FE7|nr:MULTISPECIES: biopolymer transporter ExbD [unclassified Cellvibrio]EIK45654.1 ExbD/TolR family protein [Cellvibrio sp. BR]QEY12783.1 biopolymer transporter ExbD [Cellvibrio sp. KY-YJ-3]UUA74014.1 biopolymer transporter ExbD [Cellvibrio sp. QJXJ]